MRKSVFITGSSRGLGFAIALEFAKNGYLVILNGRDSYVLEKRRLELSGDGHLIFQQDYLNEDAMVNTADFFANTGIVPSVIVHALGGKIGVDTHPIKSETLAATLKLNLQCAIEINNIVMPKMIQHGGGYIVQIGSLAGINANSSPCYAISKAALHAYIKNSARFYIKYGLVIFGIAPGILGHVDSDWDKKRNSEPQKYNDKARQTLLGRFIDPEEVAKYIIGLVLVSNSIVAGSIVELLNE